MIISNDTRQPIDYTVTDRSGQFTEQGTIGTDCSVEVQARGTEPFKVAWGNVSLDNVPSTAVVTLWGSRLGGGFSVPVAEGSR